MSGARAKSLLVTGPVERLDEWCAAAEAAGWRALPWPLVRIERVDAALSCHGRDALVVTSANAVAALDADALRLSRRACVGERCAAVLQAAGGTAPLVADTAQELLRLLADAWPRSRRILFPRGDLAAPTATALRELGHDVDDPVVYKTVALDARAAPAADAVLLASPSAVAAWTRAGRTAPCTIAIGPTTKEALEAAPAESAGDILLLPRPRPEALEQLLRGL